MKKVKGELLAAEVSECDETYQRDRIADLRTMFPDATVRTYMRAVHADGISVSVTVIVVRAKAVI